MLEEIQGMLGSLVVLQLMQTVLLIFLLALGFVIWRQEKEVNIFVDATWEAENDCDNEPEEPWRDGEPDYRDDK